MLGDRRIAGLNLKGVRGDEYEGIHSTMRVRKCRVKVIEGAV